MGLIDAISHSKGDGFTTYFPCIASYLKAECQPCKAQLFKGKYETKQEFPEGWGSNQTH